MSAYRMERYTNYNRQPIPEQSLAECDVFLYQHLDAKWGELSSERLLARLGPHSRAICLPNMFFKGYWPFWAWQEGMEHSDTLLDRLIAEGAEKAVIMRLYLEGKMITGKLVQESFEKTMEWEENKERRCAVKTTDLVRRFWREEQLFYTINHPNGRLLLHVLNEVLALLDLPALEPDALSRLTLKDLFPLYSFYEHPIHPKVAGLLGLKFAGPGYKFRIYDREMTFERFVSRYIDCRRSGYDDNFRGYLQLI